MANKTERFSRTIEYKGSLDISQILSSIDTIQKQLKNTHTKTIKDDSFSEVNKTITKLKELNRTMQEMRDKGFSNPKEFQEFLKLSEKSKNLITQIKTQLGSIKVDALAEDANNIAKAIEKQNKQISDLEKKKTSIISKSLSNKTIENNITKEIQSRKKDLEDEQNTELIIKGIIQDQLNLRKKSKSELEAEIQIAQQAYNAERASASGNLKDFQKFKFLDQTGAEKTVNGSLASFNYLTNAKSLFGEDKTQILQALKDSMIADDAVKGFQQYTDALKQLGVTYKEAGINQENFSALYNSMNQQLQSNIGVKQAKENLDNLSSQLKQTNQDIHQLQEMGSKGKDSQLATAIININTATATRNQLQQQEAAAAELSRNSNIQVENTLRNLTVEEERYNESLRQGITTTNSSVSSQNRLDSTFEQLANRFKYMLSFMSAWHTTLRALKQTFNDIQNIDKAFASIAMVTDKTIADLWNQYNDYAKIANDLGQSTESVIKSSALYYQQGLSTSEALTLTKDTMKLATLAGIDFEQSTKLMTAALRAFHMELDSGAHITDVYSELAANAAANVQDIAYAMSKTSSIAASAGMSFENTAAMLTTMIEVTQEAPENLGTAMKSVIARFTEVKKNVSDIEGDIEAIDLNKVDGALKSVGIALKDDVGQIRNLDQVFLELSAKWNDLDRNTQRYVATLAAGSRQQSRFLALMENYDRTMELIETAQDSAGRSSEQFAKYADSLENKVNKLKNTWEQFRISLVGSDLAKTAVNFANTFVKTFSKLDAKQLAGITLFGITAGKNLITGLLSGIQNSFNLISKTIGNLFSKITIGKDIETIRLNTTHLKEDKIKAEQILDGIKQKVISTRNELNNQPLTLSRGNETYQFDRLYQTLKLTDEEILKTTNLEELLSKKLQQTGWTANENSEEFKKLVQKLQEYQQALEAAKQKQEDANSSARRYKESLKELHKASTFAGIGNALSMGISTAITAAISGQDWTQTFTSTAIMTGISALTQLLQGNVYGAIGAGIVAALAGGGAWLSKTLKEKKQAALALDSYSNSIGRAQKQIEKFNKVQEELGEKLNKSLEKTEKAKKNFDDLIEAESKMEDFANQIYLTNEELEEYKQLQNELAKQFPELIDYYDQEGNAILALGKSWEDAREAKKKYYAELNEQSEREQLTYDIAEYFKQRADVDLDQAMVDSAQKWDKWVQRFGTINNLGSSIFDGIISGDINTVLGKDGRVYSKHHGDIIDVTGRTNLLNFTYDLQGLMDGMIKMMHGGTIGGASQQERAEFLNYLQELIKDTSFAEQFKDLNEFDFAEALRDFTKDRDNYTPNAYGYSVLDKLQEEILEAQAKRLEQESINSLKISELEQAKQSINQRITEHYSTLIDLFAPEGLSKNVERVLIERAKNVNGLNVDDLIKDFNETVGKQYLDNNGIILEDKVEVYAKALSDYMYNTLQNDEEIQEILKNLQEEEINTIDTFYENIKKEQPKNEKERLKLIPENLSKENKDAIKKLEKDNIYAYNQSLGQIANFFGENVFQQDDNGLRVYAENTMTGKVQDWSDEARAGFFDALDKLKEQNEDLTEDQIKEKAEQVLGKMEGNVAAYLYSQDWKSVNPSTKDSFIASLARDITNNEWAEDEDAAKKIIQDFIDIWTLKTLGGSDRYSADIAEAATNTANRTYDALIDQWNNLKPVFEIPVEVEEMQLDADEQRKIQNAFDQLNKPLDKGGLGTSYDLANYIVSGKAGVYKVKEMREDLDTLTDTLTSMREEYEKLDKIDTSKMTKEQLDDYNKLKEVIPIVETLVLSLNKNIIQSQENYRPLDDLISKLTKINDIYTNITKEIKESGYVTADTYSSASDAIKEINKELEEQNLKDLSLDIDKYFTKTAQGWKYSGDILKDLENVAKAIAENEELQKKQPDLLNLIKILQERINETKLNKIKEEWNEYAKAAEEAANAAKEAKETQIEFVRSTGSLVSNYKSAASEMIKDGKITSSTYATLADDLKKINDRYHLGLSIDNYINSKGAFNWNKYEKDLEKYILELKKQGVEANYLTQVLNDLKEAHKELQEEIKNATEEYEKSLEEVKDAQKEVEDANKNLADAYEDLAEKEKKVTELQEKLNELMYGTGDKRKSSLDGMYNYEQLLDVIDSDLESIKNNLEHINSNDNINDLISSYGQNMRAKKINLEAQKRVYQKNLDEILGNISQYSQYYLLENGRLLANISTLNAASMSDDLKNEIENQIQMYNNSAKKISDIEKQIKQVEQDYLNFRNSYRDKYISLQEQVISTIKESAKEEVETQQEKYAALEEADNDYINALEEAIKKQRELRNSLNENEELSKKEKKLSLLQRDTSGSNQKDIIKQQQDIDKSRQNIVDKNVDNIIKNLKELYKKQKESRDAEIKYQQAVLDNASYIEEANAVINSWQTAEELINWFMEHNEKTQEMTTEQLEKYSEELEQMYYDREVYMNVSMQDFVNMLNVQESEINDAVSNVAEHLTTESTRSLNEVLQNIDKAIADAQKDIDDAIKAVKEAKDKIVEAVNAVTKAIKELETANKDAAEAAKKLADTQKQLSNSSTSGGNSSSSSNITIKDEKMTWDKSVYQNKSLGSIAPALTRTQQEQLAKDLKVYVSNLNGETWYAETINRLKEKIKSGSYIDPSGNLQKFAKGGLVNYTGPAWVDGSPARPEAFLNAEDTKNIATFTNVLSNLLSLTPFRQNQSVDNSTTTTINVTVNVDSISDDYDVHDAVQKVKDEIVAAAQRVGSTVILHQ